MPDLATLELYACGALTPEVRRALDRLRAAGDVERVVALPDVHLAGEVSVGTVVATRSRIYPEAIGGDIGCGYLHWPLGVEAARFADERLAFGLLRDLIQAVPTLAQPAARVESLERGGFDPGALSCPRLSKRLAREAPRQLGTLGRGNHFLELQEDEAGELWLLLHSGSRVVGQAVLAHHLRHAVVEASCLAYFEAASAEGRAYLSDHDQAIRYARANRERMARAVVGVLEKATGAAIDTEPVLHDDHNHVRREMHDGCELLVHRKGAQVLRDGERGVIPGSMGTESVAVEGRGGGRALDSSSHGAGRRLSRTAARERLGRADVRRELRGVIYDPRHEASLIAELPSAYKDLRVVIKAQRELLRVTRRLRPRIVHKGR